MIQNLVISFSGGQTSAFLAQWLLRYYYKAVWNNELNCHVGFDPHGIEIHIIVVFANTSKEREETLIFVDKCDKAFELHLVWIETIVWFKKGKGCTFKKVDFDSACRDGSVFESVIKKYGIPNMSRKHCTREMKGVPINKYTKSIFGKGYFTAIGYRIDEPKRWKKEKQKKNAIIRKHIYPLIYWNPKTKIDINNFWDEMPFKLELESHEGNCDLCYKKSLNKLIAIIGKNPLITVWWKKMQSLYENFVNEGTKKVTVPVRFFRGHASIDELIELANKYFEGAKTETDIEVYCQALLNNYNPKQISVCDESCEPF